MLARVAFAPVLAFGFLFLSGCGPAKLNQTKTLTLDGEVMARSIDLDAQPKPQKITVEFNSSEGDVEVGVYKEADAKGDDGLLGAPTSKAIASKKGKADTFVAEVPENTPVRVIVRGMGKKTDVEVKLSNKE
jgi:hypothetical protein